MELFWPSFKVGQTKVEKMLFYRISRNSILNFSEFNFESWSRYPFERQPWPPICMRFGGILAHLQGWSKQGWKYALLSTFSELNFESGFRCPFKRYAWTPILFDDLELFWPSFKVCQTQVESTYFCWFSQFLNFKVDLDTHLRDKHGHLFLWYLEIFWPAFKIGQTKVEKRNFCRLYRNWVLKVDLGTHLRDKHGHLF